MGFEYSTIESGSNTIIVRDFFGKIVADDIIESWKFLCDENIIKENSIGIINNISQCDISMKMSDFKQVLNYMNSMELIKRLKIAVITDSPKIIIFPFLSNLLHTELKVKPFTTMEAAINWIE